MSAETTELTQQVAIITGGGRGLGRAIAQRLAGAGAAVALVARSQAELDETLALIEQSGGRAMAICSDVTDTQAVEAMVRQVAGYLGNVTLLVNNAGMVCTPSPTWETDIDEWRRVIDVNVHGTFLCSHAVLPGMIERKQGRIINLSSSAGAMPVAYGNSYSIAKTATVRFSEVLAWETKQYGLSVFALDPGAVRTKMLNYLIESEAGQKWMPHIHQYARDVGVFHTAEQTADLVALLASGKADALSGRFITVDDPITEMIAKAEQITSDDLYALRVSKLKT